MRPVNAAAARKPVPWTLSLAALLAGAATGAVLLLSSAEADPTVEGPVISQAGRSFAPALVTISPGKTLTIVNDDGRTIHHAYVDEKGLKFDSGDQDPGSTTPITFPEEGTFQVMCGIHPRMRMTVVVR